MGRKRRSPTTLRRISEEHLKYEFWMFDRALRTLRSEIVQSHTVLKNCVLEAVVIHARVVYDFFFSETSRKNDVVAGDFFVGSSTSRVSLLVEIYSENKISPTEILDIKTRVGKEVAHLTYERLTVSELQKDWLSLLERAYSIFAIVYEQFLLCADEDLLGETLRNRKRELEAE